MTIFSYFFYFISSWQLNGGLFRCKVSGEQGYKSRGKRQCGGEERRQYMEEYHSF